MEREAIACDLLDPASVVEAMQAQGVRGLGGQPLRV